MIDRIVIWIKWKCGSEGTFNNRSQLCYTCFVTDNCVNGRILYDGDFNYLDPDPLVFCYLYKLQKWDLCWGSIVCCAQRSSRSLRCEQCSMTSSVHLSWECQQPNRDRNNRLVWVTKSWPAYSLLNTNLRRRPHNREDSCLCNCFNQNYNKILERFWLSLARFEH